MTKPEIKRVVITVDMAIKMFDRKPDPLSAYTLMLVARSQWWASNLPNGEFNEILVTLESYLDHLVLKEIAAPKKGGHNDP